MTETDNIWFTLLTQNTAPIHFDYHLSAQTVFARPLVDSIFTVALVTEQSVTDVSQNVMANLVVVNRESSSRDNVGIVTVKTSGYEQDGTVAIPFKRTFMVYKREYSHTMHRSSLIGNTQGEGT